MVLRYSWSNFPVEHLISGIDDVDSRDRLELDLGILVVCNPKCGYFLLAGLPSETAEYRSFPQKRS